MARCILCNSRKQDEILYGDLLQKNDMHVHLNCLYLSTCLVQEVDEASTIPNIYGFTISSISQEAERVKDNYCCYCHKNKANVSCCEAKCRRTFHMVCGEKRNALYEFCGTYRSFCDKHGLQLKKKPSSTENCCICYDRLKNPQETYNRSKILQSPCCRNGWYHKYCLQKYAKTAGYFFKCPLCNDEYTFREEVAKLGIFLLDRDAVWELESNAYHELMERPNICSAEHCSNVNGREDATNSGFIMCSSCGHAAIHEDCLNTENNQFTCIDCLDMLAIDANITTADNESHLADTDVDIEAISDDENVTSQSTKLIDELTTTTTPTNKEHEESEDDFPVCRKMHRKTSNILLDTPELNNNVIDENDDNISEISAMLVESENEISIIKPLAVHHKRIRLLSSDSEDSEMENKENCKPERSEEDEDCENELHLKRRKKTKRARRLTLEFEEYEETLDNNNNNNNNNSQKRYNLRHKTEKPKSNLLNVSCIASRTRRRNVDNKQENQQSNSSMESDDGLVDSEVSVRRKRSAGIDLNISCVAQRTRRSLKCRNVYKT